MHKVEGREHLTKDPHSGSIINTDKHAYEIAKLHKKAILKERREKRDLEDRVNRLERIIEDIQARGEGG
jgi:hypothetical protein